MPNVENLLKMADWLETQCPQEQFDMHFFIERYCPEFSTMDYKLVLESCQTVGCVIGSIPKAFHKYPTILSNNPLQYDWIQMSYEVFGSLTDTEWWWLFSSDWGYIDNTPTGAAKRIQWFVQNDCIVPTWFTMITPSYMLSTVEDEYDPTPIEEVVPWIHKYRTEVLGQPTSTSQTE